MSYKKVPSIKSINDKQIAKLIKKTEQERVNMFINSLSPEARREFEKALARENKYYNKDDIN